MELQEYDIKVLESYWIKEEQMHKRLRYREMELLHEYKESDTNIGGGRSNRIADDTAHKAILLAEDKEYQALQRLTQGLKEVYQRLDDDMKAIIQMRYKDKDNYYEWGEIADALYISRNKVLRKRRAMLAATAEAVGYV